MPLVRWTVLCAAAELAGIAVAALWFGIVALSFGDPETFSGKLGVWLLSAASGLPEGFVLASLQSRGIRRFFGITHDRATLISRTALAAVIGWAAGAFIPIFIPFGPPDPVIANADPPPLATIVFAGGFGVVAGALFGWLQSSAFAGKALRREWLIVNTLGWMFGLPAIYVFAGIANDFEGWLARIALWAAGGVLAGASIGLATGIPLLRTVRRHGTIGLPVL
ncbi:MAG: hypothetical protein WAU86_16645 [Oricola sp.]